MPESSQFQPHPQISSATLTTVRPRDSSPDSAIFTLESNFSLFSSASASVDRCSFASDQDSFASEISLNQTVHAAELSHTKSWSGPGSDPDPNKSSDAAQSHHENHSLFARKGDKANECRDRRRSEDSSHKQDRPRPASLDLNNVSPRLRVMKKGSAFSRRSGAFPSPGTPNYRQAGILMQKGWSSERVPLHTNASRKIGASILPLNNGKTLPSKWEDAERWIFSPVSGDGSMRTAAQPDQRRPKSKSGPLGPPGLACHSLYSPAILLFDGGNGKSNFLAGSPFSTGVIAADAFVLHSSGNAAVFPASTEPCMARSASVHGCTEIQNQPSLPDSQDEVPATSMSRVISRRDMATQMSPDGSPSSCPNRSLSYSISTPSALPIMDLQGLSSSKVEVRDVQVDERVTFTRWSKKSKTWSSRGKGSEYVDNWVKKDTDAQSSTWDVSQTAKSISKAKREEAKITAWENLQKAKAEAAIKKLEMKLEKKRAASMDKIMNKLRSAQKKAQGIRSSISANQSRQVARTSVKAISFQRVRQLGSLSGCFTCHAF